MKSSALRWIALFLLLPAHGARLDGQEADSGLEVPTPSFSNPGTSPRTTQVPATGTGLKPLQPVRPLESLTPLPDSGTPARLETEMPARLETETSAPPEAETPGELPVEEGSIAPVRLPAAPAITPSPPEKKPASEARAEMLEKVADQLSLRMRMLRAREKALEEREAAVQERESRAAEREEVISEIEESLIEREEVVRRREQLPPPQAWTGDDPPSVDARYAVVLDGTSMQFYHQKNGIDPTPVASTQKLLTALIVCQRGRLDERIEIPRAATQVEPTVIGVKTGEQYTRRELLSALLVRSGNDIAAALAIDNAGSVEAFADRMNEVGRQIGLVNSNFKTPHGLPADGQYSCARDIGIVAFEAYQIPDIREIVALKNYTFVFNDGREYPLSNTNRVLRTWDACNGMKTGFTYAAGRCLVSSANVGDQHRIAVVIKSNNAAIWSDSQKLLEWSFDLEMLGPLPLAEIGG